MDELSQNKRIIKKVLYESGTPERLTDFVLEHFKPWLPTRSAAKKAVKRGIVQVNGQTVSSGIYLNQGDLIELHALDQPVKKPFRLQIQVVFEDEHIAVINKPAGYPVSGNKFRTIQNALPFNLKPGNQAGSLNNPRPVHRLDSLTAGLLLVAKTTFAMAELGKQFNNRSIKKGYEAIVCGDTPQEGEWHFPIDDMEAVTYFKKLNVTPSLYHGHLSWLSLEPHTGRTHQLRIHCAMAGFPILGDQLYATGNRIFKGKGIFLAATSLEFQHPVTGQHMQLEIPPPRKFQTIFAKARQRWLKQSREIDK